MFSRKRSLLVGALSAIGLALVVSGCSPTVALDPAADATDPACADIMVRLPDTVASEDLRQTNAQATAAWGSPSSAVLLRCGVAPYGPTTQTCVSISGIDWIEDDSKAPFYTFTTFGRLPATEVIVDSNAVSASTVLVDLQTAVAVIPQTNVCTDANDVLGPTPAPSSTGSASTGSGDATGSATGTPEPADTAAPFVVTTTPPAAG